MSNTSLDLSAITDLGWVSELVRPVQSAANSARFFIVGAMARELIFVHGFKTHPGRRTKDLDFGIRVADWQEFHRIRGELIQNATFSVIEDRPHRLKSGHGMIVDLLPFGAVEQPDRTIAWPPEENEVMTMRGFAEAADFGTLVLLPGGMSVEVASPAGLALLKIVAWKDRSNEFPGKDAYDLTIVLRGYLDAGNEDRLYEEAVELLDEPDFDFEVAGAILLGRDIAGMLADSERNAIEDILRPELDPDRSLRLASELDCDIEHALRLLQGLVRGLGERRAEPVS